MYLFSGCRTTAQEKQMKIGTAAPSKIRTRHNWTPLVNAVLNAAPKTWVNVPLSDLPGADNAQKQSHVHAAMSRNEIRCRTQTEGGVLFIQLLK
jgi:hypothetical protein